MTKHLKFRLSKKTMCHFEKLPVKSETPTPPYTLIRV